MALRFANKNSGTFDVHGPINILQSPVNSLGETSGVVRIGGVSASLMTGPAIFSSSLNLSGNVNFDRLQQRDKYRRLLLGTAKRSEFGEAPDPGSGTPYANQLATPPTWTQWTAGLNHGFVSQAISSSEYEAQNLNAYFSGTDNLETSAVPASGNLYYSKQIRYKRLIYKLSASENLPIIPTNLSEPSTDEYGTRNLGGNKFHHISGSYRNTTTTNPSVFNLFVPDYGKILDIKVWVELVHDRRSGHRPSTGSVFLAGGAGSSTRYREHGIGNLCIALRSPNTNFKWAHPYWNNEILQPSINDEVFARRIFAVGGSPENLIYRNSYLLWEGPYAAGLMAGDTSYGSSLSDNNTKKTEFEQLEYYYGGNVSIPHSASYYAVSDNDIDMRTIFYDSSPHRNPRNILPFYSNESINFQGLSNGDVYKFVTSSHSSFLTTPSIAVSSTFYLSSSGLIRMPQASLPHATGNNYPWMLDDRIPPGSLLEYGFSYNNDSNGVSTSSSPPYGWNTDGINEFTTYGMQLGPESLQPMYPLLDDVYAIKTHHERILSYTTFKDNSGDITNETDYYDSRFKDMKNIGFRPGLRGTEINGNWQLLIGNSFNGYASGSAGRSQYGYWFRNFRLEFIVEQNVGNYNSIKYKSSSNLKQSPNKIISLVSGSLKGFWLPGSIDNDPTPNSSSKDEPINLFDSPDLGTNLIFVKNNNISAIGKTVGITDHTGSDLNQYAVFTRITGALADRLSTTGQGALNAYLNNEFGTPYIPISSGSGNIRDIGNPNELSKQKAMISELLLQKPSIKQSQTLQAVLSRNNYFETLTQKRERLLSELNTYEESGFSGSLSSQLLGYFNK